MYTFGYHGDYDKKMDPEVIGLCDAINSLPGLFTYDSCSGHGKQPFRIFTAIRDDVDAKEGIFFLTSCADRRYFEHEWDTYLEVADEIRGTRLPTVIVLESYSKGKKAYKEANDLLENMNEMLNHKNWLKYYKIDLSKFNLEEA